MVWEDKGPFNMNQLGGHFLVGEGQEVFVGQTVLMDLCLWREIQVGEVQVAHRSPHGWEG